MKDKLKAIIQSALSTLQSQNCLPADIKPNIRIDDSKDKSHGDFASNIALMLAKPAGMKPSDLAQKIIEALPADEAITKVEVAGPGFLNFFINESNCFDVIEKIINEGAQYGRSNIGNGEKVMVEFVSANPTGPLHVGHGRGAAFGAALSDLLEAVGFDVYREYYVNDAGRQMNILAASVWLRYLQLCNIKLTFPSNGYQGNYVKDIAQQLHQQHKNTFACTSEQLYSNVPADENEQGEGDKEAHIDALISNAQHLLQDKYKIIFNAGLELIIDDIRGDLEDFGAIYQRWFSERSLMDDQRIDEALQRLQEKNYLYEENGATWFRSTDFGDDKDRVVKRDNGQTTYFASDIAYHMDKLDRGFDRLINIWGADHHGYIARVKAALQALGLPPEKLHIQLVQFAILYRGKERVQMSTRSGSFVTLRELRQEVGNDAARFFYVTRKADQHMDFDLELAKSQTKDNPVYYIQYAHARVCSVKRKLADQGTQWLKEEAAAQVHLLSSDYEKGLAKQLARYPEQLQRSALNYEPHTLAHYLRDLASSFHTYYNAEKVLIEDTNLRDARLALGEAVRQVLENGLKILGVSAPESM
ncbi:MAG: arginine--tRNA ligase [Gammaproteobacteria bacterium]|nr:arginine--tRNA ligase [Gammaproteobacteria bacterium]